METPIYVLTTTGECRYTLVELTLCNIEFIAHVFFICIESSIQLPAQKILYLASAPHPHAQLCGYPHPQIRINATRAG